MVCHMKKLWLKEKNYMSMVTRPGGRTQLQLFSIPEKLTVITIQVPSKPQKPNQQISAVRSNMRDRQAEMDQTSEIV